MNYPKMLYLKGWDDVSQNVIVHSHEEEKEAKKKGYKELRKPTTRKRVNKDGNQ